MLLSQFEKEMRSTSKVHPLIAVPYAGSELQLRFTWCLAGLTRYEYDSDEQIDEKVKQ